MRMTLRVIAVAALIGIGSQAFVVQAGWRHYRMFRSSCAGPSCSAPMYVAAPLANCSCGVPMWGCSGPACSAPMWGGSGPTCSYPLSYQAGYGQMGYGNLPMNAYGVGYGSGAGYGYGGGYGGLPMSGFGAGYGYRGGYAGNPYGGYYDFGAPGAGNFAAGGYGGYGAGGYGVAGMYGTPISYPQVSAFGGPGFGGAGFGYGMPSYYAPVPSQYTPVPPAPASDLVW